MSWNSGGGPWGSNGGSNNNSPEDGKKPSGGKRPHPQEVDLDDWIRKGQEQLKQAFPGGGRPGAAGPQASIFGVVIVVLGVLWLASGFYQVGTNQVGVVLRFGKVVRTEQPGLRYHLPGPIESVMLPDYTIEKKIEIGFRSFNAAGQRQDVEDESRMLTGDENIVDLDFIVNWRIKDAEAYLFNVRSPELTVKMAAESAIREVIGRMEIQPILTEKRLEIEQSTREAIQAMLDEYSSGITITRVQLLAVTPPPEVKDAFDDVTRARADGDRARNEAEAYRNDILPRAQGEAVRIVQEATGYRDQVVNIAKGDAARFESVLRAYNLSHDVTETRLYFEAMQDVLQDTNKIIIDPAATKTGAIPTLPISDLIKKAPAAPAKETP